MATDRSCEDAMHTSLPGSLPLSSNAGSPNGSGHDLDGMASRSTDEQLREIRELLLPLVPLARSVANYENHIQTITNSVVLLTSRITNIEQIVNTFSNKMASLAEMEQNYSSLTARLCKVEGDMVSASSVSGSARSWNVIGQNDGSTAAGSHGPGSSDDNRNTRRRLDTLSSTEDEQPRSAVLFRFSCEQYLKLITKWIDTLWAESNMPACNKPVRIHCKAVSQACLFLKHEAHVKTLLLDVWMMVCLMQLTVPSAAPIQLSQCVNPDQLKTERLENNLRLRGKGWLNNLKFSFLMEMTRVFSSSQLSMLARKSSASKIAETELENQFSNLLRLEADKRLLLLHLICLFFVYHLKCCNGFSVKLTGLMCDGHHLASPLIRRLAGRVAFFCCFSR